MDEPEETYGHERIRRLEAMLRELAERIADEDERGRLLESVPEWLRRLGDLRSELFHYEVRSTYDTPEAAEHRRIVEEASAPPDFLNPNEDEDQ